MSEHQEEQESKWLGDVMSPYGLSDEDATLRQGDSAKWRTLFGGKKPKRFVPVRSAAERASVVSKLESQQPVRTAQAPRLTKTGSSAPAVPAKPFSSVLFGQAFVAAVLVVGSVYVSRTHSQTAGTFKHLLHVVYKADYSSEVIPAIRSALHNLHVPSLPTVTSGNVQSAAQHSSGGGL